MGSGISKNILPGTEIPRTTLRNTSTKVLLKKTTVPLCQEFSSEGHVDILCADDPQIYEGFFSFTIYYRRTIQEFYESHYYCGLFLYAEMIHTNPAFVNAAMILYTDSETLPILTDAFSHYPKILFAVTSWPKFKIGNTVEGTVMRCMRFHATEAFPDAWICTRDADTLFTSEIMNAEQAYRKGYKGKTATGIVIDDYRPFYANLIGDWEHTFLSFWFKEGSPINLGVNINYRQRWHKEFPLIYPFKDLSRDYSNAGYDGARITLRSELGGRFRNYYKAKKLKFFMDAPVGIYAGFTNFTNKRPKDIWAYCYDYITSHYDLVDEKPNSKIISDEHVEFVDKVGKDERIILFAIIPRYLELCYFFSIEYYGSSWIYNRLRDTYTISNNLSEFSVLLNFGNIPSFKNNSGSGVKVYTVLFSQDYVKNIYEGDDKSEYLNKYFKTEFATFAADYLAWIDSILKMPKANFNSAIQEIEHMKRITGYSDDYTAIKNSDFYMPVNIIHPRKGGSRKRRPHNGLNKTHSIKSRWNRV